MFDTRVSSAKDQFPFIFKQSLVAIWRLEPPNLKHWRTSNRVFRSLSSSKLPLVATEANPSGGYGGYVHPLILELFVYIYMYTLKGTYITRHPYTQDFIGCTSLAAALLCSLTIVMRVRALIPANMFSFSILADWVFPSYIGESNSFCWKILFLLFLL